MKGLRAAFPEVKLSEKDIVVVNPEIVVNEIRRRGQGNLVVKILSTSDNLLSCDVLLKLGINCRLSKPIDVSGKVVFNRQLRLRVEAGVGFQLDFLVQFALTNIEQHGRFASPDRRRRTSPHRRCSRRGCPTS